MKKQITFTAKGVVLGNYWGGGKGAYTARPITAKSTKEIIKIAEQGIADGSLDNGMGFESLIGAALTITKTTRVEIDGAHFFNHQHDDVIVSGEGLTREEVAALMELMMDINN